MKKCGNWALGREIGRGAYGVVHQATNAGGETAAVKICLRDGVERDRYERELRGARLYKAIPPTEGLVRMLELAECEWGFYTVMELADDEFGESAGTESVYRPKTLSCVIAGERALSLKESVNLGLALAKGLETLQRHHLLHRDIKPGNILYVRGRPVLADPGLVVEETEAASLVGTPGYVPPEQFVNAGGDIYSLGLTLKAASFGRPVEELEKGPTLEADTGHPQFAVWWRILNKATDPEATRRYRSAKALLRDIKILRLKMTGVRLMNSRRAVVASVLAMGIVLMGLIAFLGVWHGRDQEEKTASQWLIYAANVAGFLRKADKSISAEINIGQFDRGLRYLKACTSVAKEEARIKSGLAELSELKKPVRGYIKSFNELRELAKKKCMNGEDVTRELRAIEKIMKEDKLYNEKALEIGRRFGLRPNPFDRAGFL